MSFKTEFRFINGAGKPALLVLEPKSCEFWIRKGAMLRIVADGGDNAHEMEVEYLSNGLVVYMPKGCNVSVYEDDRLLPQDKISRKMETRLSRS